MKFSPGSNKQANEFIFSQKQSSDNLSYPPIRFNNNEISKCLHQKHLGIVLYSKLTFNDQLYQNIKKGNRIIHLTRRLSISLP